ncbi:MAG TPA: response regulator [Tepidisphaeraceae bacterium]|mgnify:CR=1 FL=1|nr:response regulator [Tepidisphaeraceae bacterium]
MSGTAVAVPDGKMLRRSESISEPQTLKRSMMVVEDQPGTRWALVQLMQRAGFHVVGAASAEQALRLIDAGHRPDVVLADLHLPGEDGIWLLDRILKTNPKTHAVLITAHASDDGTPPDGVDRLNVPWLRKPVSISRLLGMLQDETAGTA